MSFVSILEDDEDRRNDSLHCTGKGNEPARDEDDGGAVESDELKRRRDAMKKRHKSVNRDAPATMADLVGLDARVELQIYAPLTEKIEAAREANDGLAAEIESLRESVDARVNSVGKRLAGKIDSAGKANDELAAEVETLRESVNARVNNVGKRLAGKIDSAEKANDKLAAENKRLSERLTELERRVSEAQTELERRANEAQTEKMQQRRIVVALVTAAAALFAFVGVSG